MQRWVTLSFLITCLCLFAAATAWAGDISLSGSLSNESRLRLKQNDMPDEMDWDFTTVMTTANFMLRARDEERRGRLFVDLDLRYDPTGVFDETQDMEWRLREAYGGFYSEYASFEIGKIIYAWGMADEFNPTDLLNPEDLRWVMSMGKRERKLGVFSSNLTLSYGDFSLQGVLMPLFEPNILPDADSDWLPWELGLFYGLVDAFPGFVDFQAQHVPDMSIQNADRAARFRGMVGPVDFSLVWFDGFDDLPFYKVKIDIDAEGLVTGAKPLTLRESYQRYQAYGGSLAFTAGSFSFRTEGAYYTPRQYNAGIDPSFLLVDDVIAAYQALMQLRDYDWYVESPAYSVVGGVDWRDGTWLYVNLQYAHSQILEYEKANIYNEYEGNVTAKLQTLWLDEDLEAGFDSAYNVYHNDWYMRPYVGYRWTVALKTEAGVRLFGGEPETRFGDYNYNDFAYLNLEYGF
ncbi:MAG: hypothetical protein P9L99_09855 [Candidatus Lernaella stagnicola]|nr:hypothetical protein [Candidatus Lernaella stagnicola]